MARNLADSSTTTVAATPFALPESHSTYQSDTWECPKRRGGAADAIMPNQSGRHYLVGRYQLREGCNECRRLASVTVGNATRTHELPKLVPNIGPRFTS